MAKRKSPSQATLDLVSTANPRFQRTFAQAQERQASQDFYAGLLSGITSSPRTEVNRQGNTAFRSGFGQRLAIQENALDIVKNFTGGSVGTQRTFTDLINNNIKRLKVADPVNRRAGLVAASRASQRSTSEINKLVSSGRKRTRGSNVAIPRSPAGLLGQPENKNLLLS